MRLCPTEAVSELLSQPETIMDNEESQEMKEEDFNFFKIASCVMRIALSHWYGTTSPNLFITYAPDCVVLTVAQSHAMSAKWTGPTTT